MSEALRVFDPSGIPIYYCYTAVAYQYNNVSIFITSLYLIMGHIADTKQIDCHAFDRSAAGGPVSARNDVKRIIRLN